MNRAFLKGVALVAVLAFLLTGSILVQAAPLGQDECNVYEVIQGNEDLSTLAAAIEAAGLGETLAGEGPFTVFAPNNAAFEAIPEDQLEALLADAAALNDLLLLHVVPGELMAADLAGQSPASALGDPLEIAGEGAEVTVNGASVVEADIAASNGVVHVVSSVLAAESAEAPEEEEAAAEGADVAADSEDADEAAEGDDAAADGDGDEVASEEEMSDEAEPAADAAAPAMDEVAENGDGEDGANIAERSGRPRSHYMNVWKGINQPRSMCD
jgi:uncharacterized surface protein with fasciclin (FAS1) repeats